jgi:hypothetical protein
VFWLLVEREQKMLVNFAMVSKLFLFRKLDKTNNFVMSPTKKILGRNVAFISFVGSITTIVVRR